MFRNKIVTINRLKKVSLSLKREKKKIIFTNGCFDILHYGHISYLNSAKKLGNILIVGINSDSSVKLIKGPERPINPLKDRIKILASLECVDYVCPFNQSTPLALIEKIQPDILVKGADWNKKDIVGADFVKSYGGKVATITFRKGYSTTNLIKKINSCR